MANLIAIDTKIHSVLRWKRPSGFAFAAKNMTLPLLLGEMSRAVTAFPIGFLDTGNGFLPAALLGLDEGCNFFVSPDGSWRGSHTPAVLGTYPFSLGQSEQNVKVLCFDADSGLVGEEGGPLFGEDGSLAPEISAILEVLTRMEGERQATLQASEILAKTGLIVPWEITIQDGDESRKVAGLFKVDEAAMNALADDDFLELRKRGALPLAYCQLLSMQHLQSLGRLRPVPVSTREDAIAFLLAQGETIRFSGLI